MFSSFFSVFNCFHSLSIWIFYCINEDVKINTRINISDYLQSELFLIFIFSPPSSHFLACCPAMRPSRRWGAESAETAPEGQNRKWLVATNHRPQTGPLTGCFLLSQHFLSLTYIHLNLYIYLEELRNIPGAVTLTDWCDLGLKVKGEGSVPCCYPDRAEVLQQLFCVGDAEQHRADAFTAETPGWQTHKDIRG